MLGRNIANISMNVGLLYVIKEVVCDTITENKVIATGGNQLNTCIQVLKRVNSFKI